MKNLLYLFFAITFLGCSGNDDNKNGSLDGGDEITPPRSNITFKVRELWGEKLMWDKYNTTFRYDRNICSDMLPTRSPTINSSYTKTGFETYEVSHFAIDTLEIILKVGSPHQFAKIFAIPITDDLSVLPIGKRYPKKIGHIKFVNFDDDNRLILEHIKMEPQNVNGEWFSRIDYYSSNRTEEFIESISLDGSGANFHTCKPKKVFYKNNYEENFYESTVIEITVPKDDYNSALKVGDKIGGNYKQIGSGWDSRFNNNYLILEKK
jgi:hypothetical protein